MSAARAAAAAFDLGGRILDVRPLGRGLINDTFVITTDAPRPHAVLQRINQRVFPQPELLMANLRVLLAHVARRATSDPKCRELRLPAVYKTLAGRDFHIDDAGDFWRVLSFIENSRSFERLSELPQAEEVGFALGRFHALTHDLDPKQLHITRPGFHNTPRYLARFREVAVQAKPVAPRGALRFCLEFAQERAGIVNTLEDARQSGRLRLRTIHGDPKFDNVLFDETSGKAVALVDLDTVQPGLLHHDLGDCLRSCCNPAGESPKDPGEARFDLGIARAILGCFLDETRSYLSPEDYRYLPDAIRLIPFELGLRFLTDHLEGDKYFKTDWPGHNLVRAETQFRLTADIERQHDGISALVRELARL
jgi:Ser/Thr protein kinase RdoA (MazF antagonist)